jgi:glycosyltransferase involved in cell wall biosynthesis
VHFVVCEDGSSDGSAEVLRSLSTELPITLLTGSERKGYSRAVLEGLRATRTEWVCFIDSDGQCDPADLLRFVREIASADLVLGRRSPRVDHWSRLVMSRAFGLVFRLLFQVETSDPSCPYLLVRRSALARVLEGQAGLLKQGFWWEFSARAAAASLRVREIPVRHRSRADGGPSRVYRPSAVPAIALGHLIGLLRLRYELRR